MKILNLLVKLWRVFFPPRISEMEYIALTKENVDELKKQLEPTMQEKFLQICLNALDTDPSTPDTVKDEVGCADTISHLIKKIFSDFPILVSTKDLDFKLFTDKRFQRVTEGMAGDIIISPRTATTYGHAGVFIMNDRIASNNSKTGLFQGNYTWNDWIKEFKEKRNLKIYIYRLKE
jgi:hypothetical protein